jgi:hypothetical protein
VIAIGVIVVGVILLALALMVAFAPEGWEDAEGFHYSKKER